MPVFRFVIIFLLIIFFGCGGKKEPQTKNSGTNEIVRVGVIDLFAIDQNKDGKLFECAMDYNVISDSPGQCPLCKMDLEEYTLEKTKDNLVKNDFKVK